MPTYEYRCRECGERMEVFQKFSEKPLRVHPECGGELQKVFHPSGIVFKGSGYYVTDSRSNQSSNNGSNGSDDRKPDKKEKADTTSSGKSDKSSKSDKSGKSAKSDSAPSTASD